MDRLSSVLNRSVVVTSFENVSNGISGKRIKFRTSPRACRLLTAVGSQSFLSHSLVAHWWHALKISISLTPLSLSLPTIFANTSRDIWRKGGERKICSVSQSIMLKHLCTISCSSRCIAEGRMEQTLPQSRFLLKNSLRKVNK